jgi:tetratricopeptide (TPR) repeat protein
MMHVTTPCNATRRDRRHRLLLLALLMAAGGVTLPHGFARGAAPAADAETEREARAHFRQGETHYAAGRYADALSEYEAGYDVQPLPGFLVNIAQCQRRLGSLAVARATYGKFVVVAPDSPLVPEVRGLIEELDRLIAETETAQLSRPEPNTSRDQGDGSEILPPSAIEPAAPSGAGTPGTDLTANATQTSRGSEVARQSAPSHRRWWIWGTCAVVAVGAATLALVLAAPDARTIHDGSLGTLRR